MEEIKGEKMNPTNKIKNPSQWKNKLIGILFLIIAIFGLIFWFYVRNTKSKVQKANRIIKDVTLLNQEKKRCSEILSKPEGKFTDYEYCKKLLKEFPKGD